MLLLKGHGFGDIIYGLFRTEALRTAGVFPNVLLPDRLLLWELSHRGTIKQVKEHLWTRRYNISFSVERQKRMLFPSPPWHASLPWPIVNAAYLIWRLSLRKSAGGLRTRMRGLRAAWYFFRQNCAFIRRDGGRWAKYLFFSKGADPDVKCYAEASACQKKGDLKKAEQLFLELAANAGTPQIISGAYFHLGEISLAEEKPEQARSYFEKCIRLQSDHKKANDYLALYKAGRSA
jgi:hypothetical protein